VPTEDLQAYQFHLKSFTDEYDPKGATEATIGDAVSMGSSLESQSKALSNLSLRNRETLAPKRTNTK
jgi:hypothetical protein